MEKMEKDRSFRADNSDSITYILDSKAPAMILQGFWYLRSRNTNTAGWSCVHSSSWLSSIVNWFQARPLTYKTFVVCGIARLRTQIPIEVTEPSHAEKIRQASKKQSDMSDAAFEQVIIIPSVNIIPVA